MHRLRSCSFHDFFVVSCVFVPLSLRLRRNVIIFAIFLWVIRVDSPRSWFSLGYRGI